MGNRSQCCSLNNNNNRHKIRNNLFADEAHFPRDGVKKKQKKITFMRSWLTTWNCRKRPPTSLFRKRVAWYHCRLAQWTVYFPATSDRWCLHQLFVTLTILPSTESFSTNTTSHIIPPWRSAPLLQLGCQQFPNERIGRSDGENFPPLSLELNPLDYQLWSYMQLWCTHATWRDRTTPANSQLCETYQ